jgi:hypothetical protein
LATGDPEPGATAAASAAPCAASIGKTRTHALTETDVICCIGCASNDSRHAHAVAYPDCPLSWHAMYGHQHSHCTLAGLFAVVRKGGYRAVHP